MSARIGNFSFKKLPPTGDMGQRQPDQDLLFRDSEAALMTPLDIELLFDELLDDVGIDFREGEL